MLSSGDEAGFDRGGDPSGVLTEGDLTYEELFLGRAESSRKELRHLSEVRLAVLLDDLEKIDRLLLWTDGLLYRTQPPGNGRIRVGWLRDDGESELYRPRLVKWLRLRNGKWRYRVLSRAGKAVSGRGGFATHREEVGVLIEAASELMRHRADLVGYIADLGRGVTQKNRYLSGRVVDVIEVLYRVVDAANAKGIVTVDADEVMR